MRSGLVTCVKFLFVFCLVLIFNETADAGRREKAVRGKVYKLSKDNGPWMIMVASFNTPPERYRSEEGLSPEEAANELVYELRKKGFPAYVFKREKIVETGTLRNRQAKKRNVEYTADHGGVSVLAGNFKDSNSRNAKKSLEGIKKYQPKFLTEVDKSSSNLIKLKSGGILKKTPGRKTPLSRAFLTVNPLLSPAEVRVAKDRPLLLKLNSGEEYSLLKNRGKYTVTVASFQGRTQTKAPGRKLKNPFKVTNSLDEAGKKAWELAKALRSNNVEAYVYHDKYKSIVTVGSFEEVDESGVSNTIEKYKAKEVVDKKTGKKKMQPESLILAPEGKNNKAKYWIYDTRPQLVEIPKLKK